jgi:ABC-type Fe3+-hydroxamate transport system substrate-binding protein
MQAKRLLPSLAALAFCSACGSSTSSSSVSAIAVSPSPCTVGRTNSVQMSAVATMPDGNKQTITSSAAWSTANAQTATVNPQGIVVGVNGGSTSITATYEGATGSIDCTVSP